MEYVGIDVGTRSCSASVVNEAGGIKACLEFANEESGLRTLTARLERDAKLVLESSTAAYPIHDFLQREGYAEVTAVSHALAGGAAGGGIGAAVSVAAKSLAAH